MTSLTLEYQSCQLAGDQRVIRAGLSKAFHNKENLTGRDTALGYSYVPSQFALEQLVAHTLKGGAFTSGYHEGRTRKNETWISSQMIVIDHDDNVSVADCLAVPFSRQYAAFIYPTPSSEPGNYHTRQVFILSEPVDGNPERWAALASGVIRQIGLPADDASKKPAQPWYGSTNRIEQPYINYEVVLPIEVAGALTVDEAADDMLREFARRAAPRVPVNVSSDRAVKYAAAAFDKALSKLTNAPKGQRNNTTFKVSVALFSMAAGGWPGITDTTVTAALENVIRGWPNPRKSLSTIESARKHAEPRPLELPDNPVVNLSTKVDRLSVNYSQIDAPAYFPQGVPDGIRGGLNKYFTGRTGELVELLNDAAREGYREPGEPYTREDVLEWSKALGYTFSKSTVYRLYETLADVLFPVLETGTEGISVYKTGNNPRKARCMFGVVPADVMCQTILEWAEKRVIEKAYSVKKPRPGQEDTRVLARQTPDMMSAIGAPVALADELNAALEPVLKSQGDKPYRAGKRVKRDLEQLERDMNDPHSTPLNMLWVRESGYKAAFLRAVAEANPDEGRSRSKISAMGISNGSISKYMRAAGLEQSEAQFEYHRVMQAGSIPRVAGYPLHVRVISPDGELRSYPYHKEASATLIEANLQAGNTVEIEYQMANKQRVISDVPPAPVKSPARPTRPTKTAPAKPRVYGTQHDPAWVYAQLVYALELSGWKEEIPPDPLAVVRVIRGMGIKHEKFYADGYWWVAEASPERIAS